jgi:DNA-directed RNA polymerase subunit alpha
VEDIPDLINNIKQLRIKVQDEEESKTITVPLKGPSTFTGKDMENADSSITVNDTDLVIANLTDTCNLEIEMQIDLGRGYVSSERNEQYVDVVGTITIDTFFSPIVKVKYNVEDTRVGQRTDYDKLTLEIWTDGSISPEDALAEASKIAKDHFTIFINFDEDEISSHEEVDEEDEELMRFLATPVEELELSVRSSNCLKNANIRTIGDLTEKTEDDIVKTRNFGKKSLLEIKEKLKEWNLTLGMTDYSHLKPFKKIKAEKEVKNEA